MQQFGMDYKAFEVFLLLNKDPLITKKGLADQLGYSTTLINARLETMKNMEILRPDKNIDIPLLGKRLRTEIEAGYNPNALGLQRVHVIFKGISNTSSLNSIELLIETHPYSHYMVRSFGEGLAIFSQFDLPVDSVDKIKELGSKLENLGLIEEIIVLEQKYQSKSKYNFRKWELESVQWQILEETSVLNGENPLEKAFEKFINNSDIPDLTEEESKMVHRFDLTDMKLLRELTVNGKVSPTEIAPNYDIDRSTISRRLNRLRDKVATDNKVYFKKRIFDLTNNILIYGEFGNDENFTPQSLAGFLQSEHIPFASTAVLTDDNYFWYLNLSPDYASKFLEFAWAHSKNVVSYQLDVDTSRKFYFYHHNYTEEGNWKKSDEYLIENPLVALKFNKNRF